MSELEDELCYALINLRYGVGRTKHWCNADERMGAKHTWECCNAIRAIHKAIPYEYNTELWSEIINDSSDNDGIQK